MAGLRDEFLHQTARLLVEAMQHSDDVSVMLCESRAIRLHVARSLGRTPATTPQRMETGPSLNAAQSRHLRDDLLSRLNQRITLAQLACEAGMTTHHFLVAFRKAFGDTPMAYVVRQRLRLAQRLLLQTRKDITTIARECGFSSHSHLTATFKRHLGCPPRVFRLVGKTQNPGCRNDLARTSVA